MSAKKSFLKRANATLDSLMGRLRAQRVAWTDQGVYKPASDDTANAVLVPLPALRRYAAEVAAFSDGGEALRLADAYADRQQALDAEIPRVVEAREALLRHLRELVPLAQAFAPTDEQLADLLPKTATILDKGDGQRKVCMTRAELHAFAQSVVAQARGAELQADWVGQGVRP